MSSNRLSDRALPERIETLSSNPSFANIPFFLKSQRIWYPSRFTPRPDGRLNKPPCNRQGKPATNWQDESNWMSFDEAVGLNMDGVGIVIHKALGIMGSDCDHCVQDGVIVDEWVAQKVKELNSYTEYSVSGTGTHTLVFGRLPWDKHNGEKIEMYDGSGSRFFIVTGNRVPGTPAEIRDAQDTINALHIEVFGSELEKTAPLQNQQLNPKCYTSFHKKKKREGEEGDSQLELRPANELTQNLQVRFDNLRDKRPNFASTWEMSRATSQWPFPSGQYTSSEYELSIASFLAADGWDAQEIMDFICVWRRKHGLKDPVNYSRYACTISKAIATAIPRLNGSGYTRKESKGLYRHAQTKERILGCIIETPKSPADIAQELNLIPSHVRAVLTRLHKNDKVI